MLTFTDDWGKVVDWFIFDSLQRPAAQNCCKKSVSQLHDKCQLELLAQRSSGHSSLFEKQTSEKRVTSAENFLRQPSWVV